MKKTILLFFAFCILSFHVFAAPGDILSDQNNTIWLIAAQANVVSGLLTNMNTVPQAYAATHNQSDWITWLKMEVAMDFAKVYYQAVYDAILAKIIGYNYGNARIADEYKSPQNVQTSANTITCNADPTGEGRTVILYRRVGGIFTEQSITGSLNEGTWTFSAVPAASYYVLGYNDDFASFPTEYITVID